MHAGGTTAEVVEAREGVLHLTATVPMNPAEEAAAGDAARLKARLAELGGVPVPLPPSQAFVFNPAPRRARAPSRGSPRRAPTRARC